MDLASELLSDLEGSDDDDYKAANGIINDINICFKYFCKFYLNFRMFRIITKEMRRKK